MNNPYKTPASELEEQKEISAPGFVQMLLGTAFSFISALIPTAVTPQFKSVFTGFGAELPIATQLFINYQRALWLLPILVIAVYLFWPNGKKRKFLPLLLGTISLLVSIPLIIWALYLPVYQLRSSIVSRSNKRFKVARYACVRPLTCPLGALRETPPLRMQPEQTSQPNC